MKTKWRVLSVLFCVVICAFSFTGCLDDGLAGESKLLSSPKSVERVDYTELMTENYTTFKKSLEAFAADFAAYSYADYDKKDNFAVSPISVYMALALTAQCAAGATRQEILDAMGVTLEQLKTNFSILYRSLSVEKKVDDKTTSLLQLGNSIWIDDAAKVNEPCIESLSNDYYAYSYSADFANNNGEANKAVRDFVKKQTKGLIDKDFGLSEETLFTLINTLYLKTIWNYDGEDLPFAKDSYDFTSKDGLVKSVKLLQGYYNDGRAVEFDTFSTFYTRTCNGYKIKFILPKDNYSIDQVFTAENIAEVNSISNYGNYDESTDKYYETRVLFPEYKCKYDEDIIKTLKEKFSIDLLFTDCDFSTLTDMSCYCKAIRHVTDLTVDRKGIEGAAVTAVTMDATSVPPATIKRDFVINKSFGFIITDYHDTTLFSGVVNNI